MNKNSKIAITMGDPAGIGAEIIIKALNSKDTKDQEYLLIGNREIFHKTSSEIKLPLDKKIEIIDIPCDVSKIKTGEPNAESGKLSFLILETACKMAQRQEIKAIVTAPLSKEAINMAGYNYSGQTEILQEYLEDKTNLNTYTKPEMLFVARDFRVLLLTRHIPVREVANALSIDKIVNSITALNNSLIKDFRIDKPKIAICGLNPHAGESGLIGREEQEIIIPALVKLREDYGIVIEEPFPADTIWIKAAKPYLENKPQPYDAYVSCYHDQGLIPIKLLAMDSTVNVSINLPIIRTSPAHGTAFDIAGRNAANPSSMIEAINLACRI